MIFFFKILYHKNIFAIITLDMFEISDVFFFFGCNYFTLKIAKTSDFN